MLVLGIESTCDETSASVVENGKNILSNVVSSQIDLQKQFGGVVPELACRRHLEVILPVVEKALEEAGVALEEIDLISVAYGPGLVGPLMIGLNAAKALAWAQKIPFIGVNHIEAHLYASVMGFDDELSFPCIGAVLSGGHTTLLKVEGLGEYKLLGQTVDDAVGEAFDKVARILGLPYPGGPEIERLALQGDPRAFDLSAGRVKGRPVDFSFSGLKTAVLYAAKGPRAKADSPLVIAEEQKADLAAAFQETALQDIVKKTVQVCKEEGIETVLFGGGVTCNMRLRALFRERAPHLKIFWPSMGLSLDNAAMIAGLGFVKFQSRGCGDPLSLEPKTRIALS